MNYLDCPDIITNISGRTIIFEQHSTSTLAPQEKSSGMCLRDGSEVIQFLDMGNRNEFVDFAAILIIMLVLRFLAYLTLFIRVKYAR